MSQVARFRVARRNMDMSARDVARVSAVSAATVTRFERGDADPAWSNVMRMLDSVGLGPDFRSVSRPGAVAIARRILGDDVPAPPDADLWLNRFAAMGLNGGQGDRLDVELLALRAGLYAPLDRRPSAIDLPLTAPREEIIQRLAGSGIGWAMTGDAGANRIDLYASQPWPVFYVEDLAAAADAAGLRPQRPAERLWRKVTLIPFDGFSEAGRWEDRDGVMLAAPWQIAMDCYGGGDRMPLQAQRLVPRIQQLQAAAA